MKLEYQGAYPDYNLDKSLRGTVVKLGNTDGAFVPILLDGNLMELSNQELFERALEKHYQENFSMRAENEKFREYNEMIEKGNQARKKMEDDSVKSQGTLMVLLEKLYEKGILSDEDLFIED